MRRLLIATVVVAFWAFMAMAARDHTTVYAASSAVKPCEPINLAGGILVYYCEPEYGPPFYINSVGFMTILD